MILLQLKIARTKSKNRNMARKRKRTNPNKNAEGDQKRQKTATAANRDVAPSSRISVIKQGLLAQYYPQVLSLREYLLSNLPAGSKVRRKKVTCVGRRSDDEDTEKELSNFLDHTLIGVVRCNAMLQEQRWQQRKSLSQQEDDSTVSCANLSGLYSQSEVCHCCCYYCCWECWLAFE